PPAIDGAVGWLLRTLAAGQGDRAERDGSELPQNRYPPQRPARRGSAESADEQPSNRALACQKYIIISVSYVGAWAREAAFGPHPGSIPGFVEESKSAFRPDPDSILVPEKCVDARVGKRRRPPRNSLLGTEQD